MFLIVTMGALLLQLSPAGGDLRVMHLPTYLNASETADSPLLEFVVHNGAGQYDKAADGEPPLTLSNCKTQSRRGGSFAPAQEICLESSNTMAVPIPSALPHCKEADPCTQIRIM